MERSWVQHCNSLNQFLPRIRKDLGKFEVDLNDYLTDPSTKGGVWNTLAFQYKSVSKRIEKASDVSMLLESLVVDGEDETEVTRRTKVCDEYAGKLERVVRDFSALD